MTDGERQQILKMIHDGKITAEQGLVLMRALDEEPEDQPAPAQPPEADLSPTPGIEPTTPAGVESRVNPELERKINHFRRLWTIPLVIGVAITVLGAYWMNLALQTSGFGFWFLLAWIPFLLGVLVIALAYASRSSRWLYINIQQKPGESPQRIVLAFPLPLVQWGMQLASKNTRIRDGRSTNQVMAALFAGTQSGEPLTVDVNDENGEHVQVYIG
jgi:hypothetical protein